MTAEPLETLFEIDAGQRITARVADTGEEPDWAKSTSLEEIGEGMWLRRMNFVALQPHRSRGRGDPTFSIAIFLDGEGTMSVENGPTLTVTPGTMVLFHAPHPVAGENRIKPGSRVSCVDFRFTQDVLPHIGMPALSALIREYPADCSVQDTLFLGRRTPPALARVARETMDCRLMGQARRFYLQAKALEALALVVADADTLPSEPGLREGDEARVREAADLLTTRYDEPWTIASLARAVGLNERKLKQGFKAIVGCTVHDWLMEARMEAAAHLLADGTSVTETALAVGYTNLSYFAKAFRRRHGVAPRSWWGTVQRRPAGTTSGIV